MCSVAILSPHGFFGQKDVLGKPDTGGQVTSSTVNPPSHYWLAVQPRITCLL